MAEPDLGRIDELLEAQERKFRRAFLLYVQLIQSNAVMARVMEHLEARDFNGAFRILESYIAQMADVLPRIQQEVGGATAAELAAALPEIAVAVSFDASHPRAAALVRTQRLGLIQQFSQSQLRAVQQAVNRGVGTGMGAQATAREFRSAVGLTDTQEAYVASYRRLLETRSRDALERALRDRRFDDRLRQAIEDERPLTQRQVNMMVDRYRARAIMARAETIARSEAHRAFSEAREESLEQMAEQTGIARERIRRVWHATDDKRTRDHHASMDGQERAMDEPFVDGLGNRLRYPGDPDAPANTVVNCRCPLTFRVLQAA